MCPSALQFLSRLRRPTRWLVLIILGWLPLPGVAQTPPAPDLTVIRQRAENADPEAQNALGNAYTNGLLGLAQDYAQALVWYHRAAEKGFAAAQFNLGLAYELGRGVAANETAAFGHYLRAAEQGFGAALFNVGNMYATGRGVRQDLFEANIWYRQAAEKGIPEAQFNLGLAYESGRGVKQDETQAAQWYRQAADRGFALAQYNLGLLLEDGRGLAKDELAAAKYYRAAAAQGLGAAQHNYGLMIYEGRGGLEKDPVQALFWMSLAVENGVEPQPRDTVAQNLTLAQRTAATQLLAQHRAGTGAAAATGPDEPQPRPGAALAAQVAGPAAVATPPGDHAQIANAPPRLEQARVQAVDPALVDQLRDQVSRLARQVLTLTAEKNAMESQLAVREEQKNAAPALATAAAQTERLTGLLRQAEAENRRLTQELGNLRTSASGAAATAEQSRRLGDRIRELETALQQARSLNPSDQSGSSLATELRAQVRTLQAEKNELEKWVQVLESSVKATPSQAAAQARLDEITQKLAEAEEMLSATKSALESQMKTEEKLKVENSMLTYRFQRAEEMLAAQQSPDAKPSELAELKGALLDAQQAVERLTREKAGLANVWQDSQFDLKKAQERVASLEKELAQAWKKLEHKEESAGTPRLTPVTPGDQVLTRQQLDGMVRDHENTLALLDITKQALAASQNQLAELKAEIQRLQRQVDEQRSIRSRGPSGPDKATGEQLAALQAENAALSTRLAKSQATLDLIIKAVRGDIPAPPTGANLNTPVGSP